MTGEHLDLVFKFFNFVPPVQTRVEQEKLEQEKPEFQVTIEQGQVVCGLEMSHSLKVDETFSVPSAGTVVGGKMLRYLTVLYPSVCLQLRPCGCMEE